MHDTAKRGANAVRRRPSASPSQRACSASASSMAADVVSRSRAGTSSSASIRHLPIVARRPLPAISSQHHVGVVHGLHGQDGRRAAAQQLAAASRAETRREDSVCAASSGHTRVRSQSISTRSSASPRKSVWHRCRCVWMNPGSTSAPPASMTRSCGASSQRPDCGDAAVANRHVALEHLEGVVHREDRAVADEQRHQRSRTRARPTASTCRRRAGRRSCRGGPRSARRGWPPRSPRARPRRCRGRSARAGGAASRATRRVSSSASVRRATLARLPIRPT